MLAIEIPINIFILFLVVVGAVLVGFSFRSSQMRKARAKIIELEAEMMSNHAEILELQRDNMELQTRFKELKSPVIPIKTAASKEDLSAGKMPDASLRKQLLVTDDVKQQTAAGK